ncbi:MAG: cyclase family protein [Chloroflexi bacterium]|nr:cyclase family protein [Chloroflexota bacterium]
MADDWRKVAERVRNWGRWGEDDELGTLNFITAEKVRQAASLVKQGKIFALGINFDGNGPQGANGIRRNPIHLMSVDGGDGDAAEYLLGVQAPHGQELGQIFQAGPMRFNDDYIMMPLQAGTQWDALAHVYYDGQLYNGYPASSVTSAGASKDSIDKIDKKGVASRGVLLDVARHHGVDHLPAGTAISPADLDAVAQAQGVRIESGDIVLVRTGWWRVFTENRDAHAWVMGQPGLSWTCAEWLWRHEAAAVACDNVAVEVLPPEIEDTPLAFHLLAIRDMGMILGEMWDMEALGQDCADDGVYEFQLVAPPIRVTGAVGTPLNPLAMK